MNEKLSIKLRELAKSQDKSRSKSARLREVYEDVIAAKNAGVSHQSIIKALAEEGIEFTYEGFTATLYRIKKSQGSKKIKPGKQSDSTTDEKENNDIQEQSHPDNSSTDPKDLDKIFSNRPDLEHYSRIAKAQQKKEKSK